MKEREEQRKNKREERWDKQLADMQKIMEKVAVVLKKKNSVAILVQALKIARETEVKEKLKKKLRKSGLEL